LRGKVNPEYLAEMRKIQTVGITTGGFNADPTEAQLRKLKELALGFDNARVGSSLNFSTAIAYKGTGGVTDHKDVDRYGAWLTYGYKPSAESGPLKPFTFLASVRSITQRATPSNKQFTDYGGRLLWRGPKTPINASVEYMKRRGDARDESLALSLQYQISESLYIYLSHGDALKGDNEKNQVLTVAGLNITWGNGPKLPAK
jgi:hypothetical protein